jgi:hypothetical protein
MASSSSTQKFTPALFVLSVALLLTVGTAGAAPPQYTNPLIEQRADPHIYKHTDG